MTRDLVRSRYLVLGDSTYRRADGRRVRVGYLSRSARLMSLDSATAAKLESGDVALISAAERAELTRLGALVPDAPAELADVLAALRRGSDSVARRRFTIMPTAYCNMGCSYCGQDHYKSRMAEQHVERLAERVESAIRDPGTETVSVTWFGGEPLLGYRMIGELSDRFVAAAAEAGTAYFARMATNGSLITVRKLVELHDRCALNFADITIDGPREVHNARRILKNGMGSFDRCVGVLGELARTGAAPGLHVNIRVNVDNENEARIPELLDQLATAGLNVARYTIGFMPVHSWGNDVSAVELEAQSYARREMRWLQMAQELGFGFSVLPSAPRDTTCIATSRSGEIHDPSGKVYSCSEHPLVPGVRDTEVIAQTSDLTGSARRPVGAFDDWFDQVEEEEQQCNRCPFLPVCGGSCPKLWRAGHLPCPSFKFNARDRIAMAAVTRMGLVPVGDGDHA